MSDKLDPVAQSVVDAVTKATEAGGRAEVRINPNVAIPAHIAGNILEFLRRVQSTGMEAIAWVEAYQFVQQHVPQQGPQPGVPFNGLPAKK
jgi:hypothetical protein